MNNPEPTLNRLPRLTNPQRYQGLYIIDFGDDTAVGYLAAEVVLLRESGRFPQMRAYRIHRALPDGTLELVNVPMSRFGRRREEGILFLRESEAEAREDFETLKTLAAGRLPCWAHIQFARSALGDWPFVTLLIYPAEYSDDISRWLLDVNYQGGDMVEYGGQKVGNFHRSEPEILDEARIDPAPEAAARPLSELLATRHNAVQR